MGETSSKPRTFRDTGLLLLVGLKQDECKWPVSQDAKALGGYLFCGRETKSHSYCTKHQKLNRSTRKMRQGVPAALGGARL